MAGEQTPPAAAGGGRGVNKLVSWAKAHRAEAALGAGAVGAVGIGLYRRRRAQSGQTSGTVPAAAQSSVAPYDPNSAGGTSWDPGAFDSAASSYLGHVSEQVDKIEKRTRHKKPHTGGHVKKPPPAKKPHKKPARKVPRAQQRTRREIAEQRLPRRRRTASRTQPPYQRRRRRRG
jgi:hypothetical protein